MMLSLLLGASQRCWNKGTPPCRPGASTLPGLLSGSEGSVSAPLLRTASQRTGPLGATRCPSSKPELPPQPPVSVPPCKATEPCLPRPRQPKPKHTCVTWDTRHLTGQSYAPVPPRPLHLTEMTTRVAVPGLAAFGCPCMR